MRHSKAKILIIIVALTLSACAGLQRTDPVQVTVAGIESLPGEGLELRMMVKLRVQNPNDTAIDYDGVYSMFGRVSVFWVISDRLPIVRPDPNRTYRRSGIGAPGPAI